MEKKPYIDRIRTIRKNTNHGDSIPMEVILKRFPKAQYEKSMESTLAKSVKWFILWEYDKMMRYVNGEK